MKDIEISTLLPCPCCGSSPRAEPYEDRGDYGSKTIVGVVFCKNCGLNLVTSCGQEEAEKRWNTRETSLVKRNLTFARYGFPPVDTESTGQEGATNANE